MKRLYLGLLRGLRASLRVVGLLGLLDRLTRRSRTALWLRSLLAIYDLDDLRRLDVPWWTFRAADRVEAFVTASAGCRAFEWGSGASTLWLAQRCREVTSVEHDPAWAATLAASLPANASVHVLPPAPMRSAPGIGSQKRGFEGLDFAAYVNAINDTEGTFDLVVIDGRAREACLPQALRRLAPGGVIVFDNVDRRRYREAIAAVPEDVDVEWTRGLTPCLPYPTRTALLTRRNG